MDTDDGTYSDHASWETPAAQAGVRAQIIVRMIAPDGRVIGWAQQGVRIEVGRARWSAGMEEVGRAAIEAAAHAMGDKLEGFAHGT